MADQTLAKHINVLRVLTLLRTEGRMTRADIARRLKLTPATITRLIQGLCERQLVIEAHDSSRNVREPGRPGITVSLNPDGAFFVGVELGVGHLRFAVIDMCADVARAEETTISPAVSPKQAVTRIADQIRRISREPRFAGRIQGIGVTVPGLVNSEGHVVHLPILGWTDVNLLQLLQARVDMPVFVENNADAAAFGAAYTRPSIAGDCALFLKLGTGCGGAAIINGRLLRGAHGMAGEFGHFRISEQGPTCHCGRIGCLETFVNVKALARNLTGSDILTEDELESLPEETALKASSGDQNARNAAQVLSDSLAKGIASLTNIFNPSVVFIGGPMRPVVAINIEYISQQVAESIVPGMTRPTIKMSEHGNLECAVGAAAVAHHHLFDVPWTDTAHAFEEM